MPMTFSWQSQVPQNSTPRLGGEHHLHPQPLSSLHCLSAHLLKITSKLHRGSAETQTGKTFN